MGGQAISRSASDLTLIDQGHTRKTAEFGDLITGGRSVAGAEELAKENVSAKFVALDVLTLGGATRKLNEQKEIISSVQKQSENERVAQTVQRQKKNSLLRGSNLQSERSLLSNL